MPKSGDVQLTINDGNGAVVVPSSSVQAIFGCSSTGTAAQVVATRSLTTLTSTFGYGPLVEAASMTILAGGTALCLKTTSNTAGTSSSVSAFATGTSVVTVTGTPNDSAIVNLVVVTGGTIGSSGCVIKLSFDAGRTYGPNIALGTATTYVVPNLGITLNFGAGTLVANENVYFYTTEPLWNTAGVQAAMNALQASPYALTGWGSAHLVGPCTGANASTIGTYMNTWATGKIFSRMILDAPDAAIPAAWGGAGQTEAAWISAQLTSFASTANTRLCVAIGHYNFGSNIYNSAAGLPRYRRSLGYELAAREVAIPPQRHVGRVKDGPLPDVIVDSINDPTDGFIYHDERLNPAFDGAGFCSAWTRIKKKGYYIKNPNLMSPVGSSFTMLPLGNVMDIACDIVNTIGTNDINNDIRLNDNGTIYENEAQALEKAFMRALTDNMISTSMISNASVAVDRTNIISNTSTVNVSVTILARGYVLQMNLSIGFGTLAQQTGS